MKTGTLHKKVSQLFSSSDALSVLTDIIGQSHSPFWLVGGCLRDLLLERPISDIDLISCDDPTPLARQWSFRVDGHWFWLDSERLQSRVVLRDSTCVDFSVFRARTLHEDLKQRDFTINSMALPVSTVDLTLIDPLDGLSDLAKKILRLSSVESYTHDPLRMIKGIRHAVTLNFDYQPETWKMIGIHAEKLAWVAGERIREELIKILSAQDCLRGIDLLYKSGLLDKLLKPLTPITDWCQILKQLKALSSKLNILKETGKTGREAHERRDRVADTSLFLLIELLKLSPPGNLSKLLQQTLRLSRNEQRLITQLLAERNTAHEPCKLLQQNLPQRRTALLVEELEPFALEKMLYWYVCRERLAYPKAIQAYKCFLREQSYGRVADLLSGDEFKRWADVTDNSTLGQWLKKIKRAEIAGLICSREDAIEWLRTQISD